MRSTGAIPASRKRALAPEPRSQAPSDRQSRAVAMAAARDRRDRDHQPAGGAYLPTRPSSIARRLVCPHPARRPAARRARAWTMVMDRSAITREALGHLQILPGALTAAAPPQRIDVAPMRADQTAGRRRRASEGVTPASRFAPPREPFANPAPHRAGEVAGRPSPLRACGSCWRPIQARAISQTAFEAWGRP
jgi:hypothetical protein